MSADGQVTGKVNGQDIGLVKVFSDVSSGGGSTTAYIVARKDFEGFDKPATNGKQLLIRISPYNGIGTYNSSAQAFWVYEENINTNGSTSLSSKLHRYSNTETSGNISIEITSDNTENGKRVLRGKFSGESGTTLQINGMNEVKLPLETLKISDLSFIAPQKNP